MEWSHEHVEWQVQWFEETDSTNRWLAQQCRAGAPAGLVAIAAEQSAGRGRLDRTWIAPKHSALLMSILLRPNTPPETWHLNTFRVALAALAAIDPLLSLDQARASIKWPNDVMLMVRGLAGEGGAREAKLAGILAEAILPTTTQPGGVVVGIGCNTTRPERVPEEIATRAIWLSDVGVSIDPRTLGENLLHNLTDRLAEPAEQLIADLTQRSSTLGRTVRAELPDRTIDGVAESFDGDAALRVRDASGILHTVRVGDIVHLR